MNYQQDITKEMQAIIKEAVEPYKDKITTSKEWPKIARKHRLPSLSTIYRYFESWTEFVSLFNETERKMTKEEIIELLQNHKDNLTTRRKWDAYAKKHELPSSTVLISYFDSWNDCKAHFGLNPSKKPIKYTPEKIIELVKDHKEYLINKKTWNAYAKKHDLPSYETINANMSWNELKRRLNVKSKVMEDDELIFIAKSHRDYFTTMSQWDVYAKLHDLPRSITYHRRFGWEKVKEMINKK